MSTAKKQTKPTPWGKTYPDLAYDQSREAGRKYIGVLAVMHVFDIDIDFGVTDSFVWAKARTGLTMDECAAIYRDTYIAAAKLPGAVNTDTGWFYLAGL